MSTEPTTTPETTETNSRVVLATNNVKKLRELRRILSAQGIEVLGLADVEASLDPPETELTFQGNAVLKAKACALATGLPALADDSGLSVEVLAGMPGVRSARWAGPGSTDQENLDLLLRQLADVPEERRAAKFVCALALVLPDGTAEVTHGEMPGRLTLAPRGVNGFGYDPIFLPEGSEQTTAEMGPSEKDAISHRGRAIRAMVPLLTAALDKVKAGKGE